MVDALPDAGVTHGSPGNGLSARPEVLARMRLHRACQPPMGWSQIVEVFSRDLRFAEIFGERKIPILPASDVPSR